MDMVCLYLADLGEARGCTTNTFVIHELINSFIHPLVNYLYGGVMHKWLKMVLPVIKQTILTFFFRDPKS